MARVQIEMSYNERYAIPVVEEIPAIVADNGIMIIIMLAVGGLIALAVLYFVCKSIVNFIIRMRDESRNNKTKKPPKKVNKNAEMEFKIPEFPRG